MCTIKKVILHLHKQFFRKDTKEEKYIFTWIWENILARGIHWFIPFCYIFNSLVPIIVTSKTKNPPKFRQTTDEIRILGRF